MPLDSQGKIAKLWPCTLESQKLEDDPEQRQHISFLGSQVGSCGRRGAESKAPLLVNLLELCLVLHREPETPYGYP